jgi:hypothetical protein
MKDSDEYAEIKVGNIKRKRMEHGMDTARWEPPTPLLQRKRSSDFNVDDRPVKAIKLKNIGRKGSGDFLTCKLTIPAWMDQGRDLFRKS